MSTDPCHHSFDIVDTGYDPASCGRRPWLGVRFECCNVYVRVYKNRDGTAYAGRCPKCGLPVNVRVGPDGTSSRFFTAS